MGCDIHLHTEVKIKGKWQHYSIPKIYRDYDLFSKLANVRNNNLKTIEPIAEPRGIPKNATFLTKYDCDRWGTDGHSHSWIDSKEISVLFKWLQERNPKRKFDEFNQFGYLFGNFWSSFNDEPDANPNYLEDVRFIFWFDN